MKKSLLFFGILFLMAPSAHADITSRLSSSVQLTVDASASQATRIGSSYSVSGSNVSATLGGLTAPVSATAAATMNAGTYTQTTDGSAITFTEAFTQGDAVNVINSGSTVSSGVVSSLPAYGQVTTTAGGVAGTLAGSVDSAGAIGSLTAGGAGTSATGQFVSEITVR
jgi:hypothetical protein